jgi:hypothetical protein
MSDERGMPVSPHGDSSPWEWQPGSGQRSQDGDNTPPHGTRFSWSEAPENSGPSPETASQARYQPPVPSDDLGTLREMTPRSRGAVSAGNRTGSDSWTGGGSTATGQRTMKIGIWGSPASGKSTYLAALQHATGNAPRSLGDWTIFARTPQAEELLIRWNQQLAEEHKFPEATGLAAETQLLWRFKGELAGSRYQPLVRRLRRVPEPSTFDLDLIDTSGEVFGPSPSEKNVPMDVVNRTLDHLAHARGLIFLFDPIREREDPTVVNYMNRMLTQLAGLVERQGRTNGRYLPHYISVCVTKFDDQLLFQQACRAGFVNSGRDGIPRVLDKHAELFFDALCEGRFWEETDGRGSSGPKFVRARLQKYFDPARIRYYVSSAIGFNRGSDGRFNPARYAMVREEEDGNRIIGPIEPVNVLEPLVELYMKLRRRA